MISKTLIAAFTFLCISLLIASCEASSLSNDNSINVVKVQARELLAPVSGEDANELYSG